MKCTVKYSISTCLSVTVTDLVTEKLPPPNFSWQTSENVFKMVQYIGLNYSVSSSTNNVRSSTVLTVPSIQLISH